MSENSSSPEKIGYTLIVSMVSLSVFLTQFIFRSLDDNRLTNWQWAFTVVDANRIALILVFGTIAAYLFSKSSFPERHPCLFLFFSSFTACIFFWKEPEVIVDVSRYFTYAKHLEIYGVRYFIQEWGRGINAWTDLPLVPFLYGLIFKFLGESRLYIQIFTTFLFSMTVVLTYKTGKILWDGETGFFAGMALLGMPYLFTQVPLMLVDVPAMFFFMLSIFTFIRAIDEGGIRMIAFSAIALFMAFFSKYSIWLMLSVLLIIYIVYIMNKSQHRNRYIYRGGLVALTAGFLIGIAVLLKFDVISGQIKFLQEYQMPGLKQWEESFVSTFLFQIHPFITSAALYSFYAAFKKRDLRYAIISWLVILVFALQIKRSRYIIMVFPMLALMASYGLREIRDKGMRRFIIACAVMSSLVVAIFVYLPFLEKMSAVNLKNAGIFLNSIDAENVEILTISSANDDVNQAVSVPIFDLFTGKNISYRYEEGSAPAPGKFKESPLRFTWEYINPAYYSSAGNLNKNQAVVIISSGHSKIPLSYEDKIKNLSIKRVFNASENVFNYKTFITIYYKKK